MTVTYHKETHHSKCSKCLLLALRDAIKQSRHCSIDWSMKLCWLLTIFQSNAISGHGHTSLVSDKHVPAFRFQLVSPGAGVHRCGFHADRGEIEWCIGLLLWCLAAQLLPYICQAAGDLFYSAPPMHKSTELLWDKTPDFTPDLRPSNITRPQSCRVQNMDSHSGMHLSETASVVIHHR